MLYYSVATERLAAPFTCALAATVHGRRRGGLLHRMRCPPRPATAGGSGQRDGRRAGGHRGHYLQSLHTSKGPGQMARRGKQHPTLAISQGEEEVTLCSRCGDQPPLRNCTQDHSTHTQPAQSWRAVCYSAITATGQPGGPLQQQGSQAGGRQHSHWHSHGRGAGGGERLASGRLASGRLASGRLASGRGRLGSGLRQQGRGWGGGKERLWWGKAGMLAEFLNCI